MAKSIKDGKRKPAPESIKDSDTKDKNLIKKFEGLVGYLRGEFPELRDSESVVLRSLEESLPGINFKLSFIKGKEGLESRIKDALTKNNPAQIEEEDHTSLKEYYGFLASSLYKYMCHMVPEAFPQNKSNPTAKTAVPASQQSDSSLLNLFLSEPREEEVIVELEKRSRGMPFLAYLDGPLRYDTCRPELSLELLKNARRGYANPTKMEGCTVYSMEQVDIKNRIRCECPLCEGAPLLRGVCPVCNVDFSDVSLEDKRKIRVGLNYLQRASTKGGGPLWEVYDYQSLCKTSPEAGVRFVNSNGLILSHMERLEAEGKIPTLLIVDDPVSFGKDPEVTLKMVDAFHRIRGV